MTARTPIASDSDNGFLLRIAGKALALASVVALSLPLIGFGQVAGVLPGGINSNHYGNIADLAATFNRPAAVQTVKDTPTLQLIGEVHENYSPGTFLHRYPHRENTPGDSAVGIYGAFGGLAGAGIIGAAGSAFANAAEKRAGNSLAFVKGAAEATGTAVTANKPLNLFMAFDMIDGNPGPVTKGAAMAYGLIFASAAVAVPTYLSGKSIYDNFIRTPAPAPGG
jgi:hypothetical protein